jgi:dienelactone hydrolase
VVVSLRTGAELRLTGDVFADAVVCVNGGQRDEVEGTWSASLEWLVHRLAPSFPRLALAEVRYRIKSWRRLDACVEDALSAIDHVLAAGAKRVVLLGFSMGGAVSVGAAGHPAVHELIGLAPWFPERLPLESLRGRRLAVFHGALDRWLPGIPCVSPRNSRRGFERALDAGARGTYELIPWAVHGIALRSPGGGLVPLPRAGRWADLVGGELRRFQASSA